MFSNGSNTAVMYDFVARSSSSSLGSNDQSPSLGSANALSSNDSNGQTENHPNGYSSNGHSSNGHAFNGHASNGQNGHASNGQMLSGELSNEHSVNGESANGQVTSNESSLPANSRNMLPQFTNPFAACNFIVTWDGEDVRAVFEAIKVARSSGDRFIQDKLIEYILNIPFRNPRPDDIPAFVGKPIWAVDRHGFALVGMPGAEIIVSVESLRQQLNSGKSVV